ncbi:MAG: M28 family peptidase [Pseudomonadota bacterium]
MTEAVPDAQNRMMSDLNALCDFGGRLCGTASESAARDWLAEAGSQALGVPVAMHLVSYDGWRATRTSLTIPGLGAVEAHPLLKSTATPKGGIEAEVLDLGRGLDADFSQVGEALRGKIAMVRHEVMFSEDTFHRRKKLKLARAAGAVGVLVVSRLPGEPVTGSARATEPTLPAVGISPETAAHLSRTSDREKRARIIIETDETSVEATNLIFDRPSTSGKTVVLSAHFDGHDLGESALDNASGVAACLEVARRLSRVKTRHGLRLVFFTVEEWGLLGSHKYLQDQTEEERSAIILNINADTVVGGTRLTAMTSGFKGVSRWLETTAKQIGAELQVFEPFQANSDNASFARFGIPAFRLVSGFNEPESSVKYVLTRGDVRALVDPKAMQNAADTLESIARCALNASDIETESWRFPHKDTQNA